MSNQTKSSTQKKKRVDLGRRKCLMTSSTGNLPVRKPQDQSNPIPHSRIKSRFGKINMSKGIFGRIIYLAGSFKTNQIQFPTQEEMVDLGRKVC